MTLNLKDPEGLAVFKRLVAKADVFRPDVKARLGIDCESLRAINPRLVNGTISGFGQDGPYHKRPGFDQIAQGIGGLMSITSAPGEGPTRRAELVAADALADIPGVHGRKRLRVAVWFPSAAIAAKVLTGAHVDSSKWVSPRYPQPIIIAA